MSRMVTCIVAGTLVFGSAALAAAQDLEHKRGGHGGKGGGDRPSSRPAPQVHRGGPDVRQQASPRRAPPAANVQNRPRERRDAGTRHFDRPTARPRAVEQRERRTVQKRWIEQQSAKQRERAAERRNEHKRAAERKNERKRAIEHENERKRAAERERAAKQDRKLQAGKKMDEPSVAQKRDNARTASHEELRRKGLNLSVDQRIRLRTAFNVDRARMTNARFARRVGTRIPRTVRLFALPAAVFAIFPDYRSYRYVVVEDDICIVDPDTYEIIDVLDEDSVSPPRDTPQVAQLTLTAAERALVLDSISPDYPEAEVRLRLALGADIPDRVELHEFAPLVLDNVPKLRNFRFVVAQGSVVIVDPRDRSIVLVLER